MTDIVFEKIYSDELWKEVNEENKLILEDFLLELKIKGRMATTIYQYKNDLRILFIYILKRCDNKSVLQMSRKDYRNMMLWLKEERKLSNGRVNRFLSTCRTLTNYLEEEDSYDYQISQASKIKNLPKIPIRPIVFLDDLTIHKLIDYFLYKERYRDATLCALLYETGARKNEVTQIQKHSFYDKNKRYANKVVGKGGKVYRPIYGDLSYKCASYYLRERGYDEIDALFINEFHRPANGENIYDWVKGWIDDLYAVTGKYYNINVHSFRHSMIENNLKGDTDICRKFKMKDGMHVYALSTLVNHSNIETTYSYAKNDKEEKLSRLFGIEFEDDD